MLFQLQRCFQFEGRGEAFMSPIDVILTPHDVVQPELVVVANPAQLSARA